MSGNVLVKPFNVGHIDYKDVNVTIPENTIMFGYRGSHAHGLYVPKSDPKSIDDIDYMGFVIAPVEHYLGLSDWGSRGTKEIKEGPLDIVLYEIKKAFSLLLQGNPNIVSMLWLDKLDYRVKHELFDKILEQRNIFVGKHMYHAFAGYAYGQLERMETRDPEELRLYLAVTKELKARGIHPNEKGVKTPYVAMTGEERDAVNWDDDKLLQRMKSYHKKGENLGYLGDKRKNLVLEYGYDTKNAAHLIRLLKMCIEFLDTGEMIVKRTEDRDYLLSVKQGKHPLSDIKKLSDQLFADAKIAYEKSALPEKPDYHKAEQLLVEIIRSTL